MSERDRLYLGHIIAAIDDVAAFSAGDRALFVADRKTQSAVIRELQVIGEAVKQLSPELIASYPSIPWRQIADARDRLVHGYFIVDLEAVWSMVEDDLPTLRAGVQAMLDGRSI